MIRVYVAGKAVARNLPSLEGIIFLEPYIYTDEIGERDSDVYVPRDLALLSSSDIILVIIETGEELNTFIETGIAFARGIPIMAVINPELKGRTHFLAQISTSVFISLKDALDALEIIGREEWRQRLQELRQQGIEDGNNQFPRRR